MEQMVKANDLVLLGACNHPDTTWDNFNAAFFFISEMVDFMADNFPNWNSVKGKYWGSYPK